MKKPKNYCPYKDNKKCFHKDNHSGDRNIKRKCGYPKSPESCPLYLDWVEVIDMDYLEESTIPAPINTPKTDKGESM